MTFKQLISYLKDNPQKYWFKRKLYGWGWVPATWQGWVVMLSFITFIIFQSILLEYTPQGKSDAILFFCITFLSVIALILICKVKGEAPGWKWGLSKEEKERYSG